MNPSILKSRRPQISRRGFPKAKRDSAGSLAIGCLWRYGAHSRTSSVFSFKGALDMWDWEFPVRQDLVNKYIKILEAEERGCPDQLPGLSLGRYGNKNPGCHLCEEWSTAF